MAEKEADPADVIAAYRRRREQMVPMLLGAAAGILLVLGVLLIVLWITGDSPPSLLGFLASETPTPTPTSTPEPPTETPTPSLTPTITETPTPEGPITYIVEEGDTLFSIAEQFEISLDLLLAYNPDIADAGTIFIGQELIIPASDAELPTATPLPGTLVPGQEIEYRVQAGDTLETIAAEFNSTAEAIAELNDIEDPNDIFIGQILIVPVNIVTPVPTATPNPNTATPTPRP